MPLRARRVWKTCSLLPFRITVRKTIDPYRDGLYRVSITVSGTSTRIWEYLDLSDTIPSGARYVSPLYGSYYSYDNNASAYLGLEAGQRLRGGVYICDWDLRGDWDKTECPEYYFSTEVSYLIRGAVKGEFIAEPAIVRNLGTDVYTVSERYTVRMSDDEWVISIK